MPDSLSESFAVLRQRAAGTASTDMRQPHPLRVAAPDPTESCVRSLRRQLDRLRERNGKGPLLDALAGSLVVEARSLGEAGRIVCELESVCDELRAGAMPTARRA